jgi:hypothetical protein
MPNPIIHPPHHGGGITINPPAGRKPPKPPVSRRGQQPVPPGGGNLPPARRSGSGLGTPTRKPAGCSPTPTGGHFGHHKGRSPAPEDTAGLRNLLTDGKRRSQGKHFGFSKA